MAARHWSGPSALALITIGFLGVYVFIWNAPRYVKSFRKNENASSHLIGQDVYANETNEDRQQKLKDFCSNVAQPSHNLSTRMHSNAMFWLLADDDHKALYCTISKASSSTWKHVLLKARDPAVSELNRRMHFRDILERHGLRYLVDYSEDEVEFRLQNYFKYIIVRDPIDRLVSTHRDKLVTDAGYYRDDVGESIKRLYRPKDMPMEEDLQFWEFVKYVVNNDPVEFDRHWLPQVYACDPCNVHYDYIAKVETMERDALAIFQRIGLPWIGLPRMNSHGSSESQSLEDIYAAIESADRDTLSKIYKNDMDAFGYSEHW